LQNLDLTFDSDKKFESPQDPERKQWFDEVSRFEPLNLRKLAVVVGKGIVSMNDDHNLWEENEDGFKYFVQIGLSIEAVFRFCKLVKGGRLRLKNVPLHLFKGCFTFTNPC